MGFCIFFIIVIKRCRHRAGFLLKSAGSVPKDVSRPNIVYYNRSILWDGNETNNINVNFYHAKLKIFSIRIL